MAFKPAKALLSATALILMSLPAFAAGPSCYPINDLASNNAVPQLAVVAPGPARLHFLKSGDAQRGCPSSAPNCAVAAFVVPGDSVVVTSVQGDYACTAFTGGAPKFTTTGGWLPVSALTNAPPMPPLPPSAWFGDWKVSYDRDIRISPARKGGGNFDVTSTFAGQPIATDGVHLPGYQATTQLRGVFAAFSLDLDKGTVKNINAEPNNPNLCRARFWLLGPYMVAVDNGCGIPENGTATGIYRSASSHPPLAVAPPPPVIMQPPPRVVVVQPPPQPPQVVVVPGAPPRPSKAAAVRACSNEVVRRNNIAGTTSNSVDNIVDIYANGLGLVVEGIWSATRDTGYQHGNFTCQWDGQFADVRMNVTETAPPPPSPQPQRPRFVDQRPRQPVQTEPPEVNTSPFVDERPKKSPEPEPPEVDTPAFHREGGDNGDNGGGHPDMPVQRDNGGDGQSGGGDDNGGGHPDFPPPRDDGGDGSDSN
jgi:hypothetical protein